MADDEQCDLDELVALLDQDDAAQSVPSDSASTIVKPVSADNTDCHFSACDEASFEELSALLDADENDNNDKKTVDDIADAEKVNDIADAQTVDDATDIPTLDTSAQEDELAMLRARVAMLEGQLSQKPSQKATMTVPDNDDKPLKKPAHITLIEDPGFFDADSSHHRSPLASRSSGHIADGSKEKKHADHDRDSDSDWDDMEGERPQLSKNGEEIKRILKRGPKERVAHTPKYTNRPSFTKKLSPQSQSKTPQSLKNQSPPSSLFQRSKALHQRQAISPRTTPAQKQGTHSQNSSQKEPSGLHSQTQRPAHGSLPQRPGNGTVPQNPGNGTIPQTPGNGKSPLINKSHQINGLLHGKDNRNIIREPISGIRVMNPKITLSFMKNQLSSRKTVKLSHLHSRQSTLDVKDNWVTSGVLFQKVAPKQDSKGKTFCIWKLSDLDNCDRVIIFFLFSDIYNQHWKNDVGLVVGLLNPTIMKNAEKIQTEVPVTIDHPDQLLIMGQSADLGFCKGTTKAGNKCNHFLNKELGEFCTFHVQKAYTKVCSKRTDLQSGYSGITPKTGLKKLLPSNGLYFYQGHTYTSAQSSHSKDDKVTLTALKGQCGKMSDNKVTTLSLHEIAPEDQEVLDKLAKTKDESFLEILNTPSSGSMNLVKHLIKKERVEKGNTTGELIQSITANDLIKQHKRDMQQRRKQQLSIKESPATNVSNKSTENRENQKPMLGRGLTPCGEITLDISSRTMPLSTNGAHSQELAKKAAIAKIKATGGVAKVDPNEVKKKLTSPEAQSKIRKRVADSMANDELSLSASSSLSDDQHQRPVKRSKYLGNVDLGDPEVQKLLKAKSSHHGAVSELETEREEKYFNTLEKKEMYEEKMAGIMEQKCKVVTCQECNYTAQSPKDTCKQENHTLTWHKGVKRFFKCRHCNNRTTSLDRYPNHPCRNCGEQSYEKTSMMKEKTGPKLESEILSLRGDEIKFLNSLQS